MSYQAVRWAQDEAPMLRMPSGKPDTTARSVLVARAERCDEFGVGTYASIVEIIWRTGYDERTIQRAEERLEAAGLLVRVGTTKWGTPCWNVDMSKKRDPAERAEIEAAIERRKSDNATRERARREKQRDAQKARVDSASTRVDVNSTRVDSASTRVDSGSARVDATPPEPPTNLQGTPREATQESPSGGTLPPDPLRPQSPAAPGTGIESSLSSAAQEPPQPETATHDRAREAEPAGPPNLRLVVDNITAEPTADRPKASSAKGFGFCLACHAEGHTTLAVDPIAGNACATHLHARSAG